MQELWGELTPVGIEFTDEQRKVLSETRKWSQNFFEQAKKDDRFVMGGHFFDHNERVAGMAAYLSVHEGYQPFYPVLSALVLDVGRTSTDPRAHSYLHGKLSSEMVGPFLETIDLISDADRVLVLNAIEDHPLLNNQIPEERQTTLVKILMDADRLDSIGALGPVRAGATRWRYPLYTGTEGTSPLESDLVSIYQDFGYRVPKWYESIWTETARKIATPRLEFLKQFNEQFRAEASFMKENFDGLRI